MSVLLGLAPVLDNFAADREHNFSTFFGAPQLDHVSVSRRTGIRRQWSSWTLRTRCGTWKAYAKHNSRTGYTEIKWHQPNSQPNLWQSLVFEYDRGKPVITLSTCLPVLNQAYFLVRRPDMGTLEGRVHSGPELWGHCVGNHSTSPARPILWRYMQSLVEHRMPYGMFSAYYRPRYCPVQDPILEQPLAMAGARA